MSPKPDNNSDRVHHLHLYIEYPLTINVRHFYHQSPSGQPVTAFLTIGGQVVGTSPNAASITVDEVNKSLELMWVDDKGDTDAPAPPNAQVAYDSDNPAVATVDAQSGKITPVAEGQFNASATVTDSSTGQPLEMNGQPLTINPATVQVLPGAAVGAELGIQQVS